MPQVIETVVYPISELDDSARETARNWYRQHCFDHPWYDFVFEDFQTICELLGIRIATSPVHRIGGPSREDPQIYFRGFSWQGDGACFVGRYCYARNSTAAIHAHAPQDRELHRIAETLHDVQRRNFWQLRADIRHRGHYTHEYSMAIDVERDSPNWQPPTDDAEDTVTEAMRDLARWLYRQLEREYDYLASDEQADESIALNGYTFTADGERFG